MLVRREAILFELETTYRDSTTADASDAVFVFDQNWSNEAKVLQRQGPSDTLASFRSLHSGRIATISFKVELKGSGTPGDAPEFSKLLQCCGMSETISAGTSVTYMPDTTSIPSGVLYYYQDGKLRIMRGVRGNAKFVMQAREYGYIEFTMTGHPGAETDSPIINPSYSSITPPQVVAGSVSIGGTSIELTKIEIDLTNEIAKPDSINSSTGVGEVRISSRDVTGTIDPEAELVAYHPFENDWSSNTGRAFASGAIGGSSGNIYAFNAPIMYIKDIQDGDREGIRTNEIQVGFAENVGDDEISLVFT